MLSRLNIFEIVTDGLKIIKGETKNIPFVVFFLLFPLFFAVSFVFLNFKIDNDIVSNIISSISLLSGLLFSVIFILIGNYLSRKKDFSNTDVEIEQERYLKRYKHFTTDLTTLILFSIVIAIFTIVASFLFGVLDKNATNEKDGSDLILFTIQLKEFVFNFNKSQLYPVIKLITALINYLLYLYFTIILIIIKEVYTMIYDDINLPK